jgi:urease accessory protein
MMRLMDDMLAAAAVTQPAQERSDGRGHVEVAAVRGRTVVTRSSASSPLKFLTPHTRGMSSAWIVTSTYGGGLLGGDAISLNLVAGPGTRCVLGTQASTKVYRSGGGATSRQALHAVIDTGAVLISAPDPIVCYAGSRYEQSQRFDLARGAGLVMIDSLTSGRRARGERWAFERYQSRTEVNFDDRCVFRDAVALDPCDGPIESAARMGLCECFASVIVAGEPLREQAAAILDFVNGQPISRNLRLMFSASAFEQGVVLRVGGRETETVGAWIRDRLRFVTELVGHDPWSRKC